MFGEATGREPPGYYDYDASVVFTGPLVRATPPKQLRVLASDGLEAEATEVGTFVVPLGGGTALRVLRIPVAGGDESELEIFFSDQSNGDGTYPAGRFVSLLPLANGQFRLDFNRARNPFCAYSPVYPCPAPWRGNTVPAGRPSGRASATNDSLARHASRGQPGGAVLAPGFLASGARSGRRPTAVRVAARTRRGGLAGTALQRLPGASPFPG